MALNYVIAEEIAIVELKNFIEEIQVKEVEDSEVTEKYPDVLTAIRLGILTLSGEKPKFELHKPIKNTDGLNVLTSVVLKTRVSFTELKRLKVGIDADKDKIDFLLRLVGFVIDQPAAIVDKLSRFDYAVLDQLTTLFL